MRHPGGLEGFHDAVSVWFTRSYGEPTRVQTLGWPAICSGSGALLLAPTGSRKTLAAFLVAIDRLMFETPPPPEERCRVLVVGARDRHGRHRPRDPGRVPALGGKRPPAHWARRASRERPELLNKVLPRRPFSRFEPPRQGGCPQVPGGPFPDWCHVRLRRHSHFVTEM
jgi:hypothetical protein